MIKEKLDDLESAIHLHALGLPNKDVAELLLRLADVYKRRIERRSNKKILKIEEHKLDIPGAK